MTLTPGTRMHGGGEIDEATATGAPFIAAPLTGTTVTLGIKNTVVWVNPAAGIAALTIVLPAQPLAGMVVDVGFGQAVTALTVNDALGNAVETSAGATAGAHQYRYINTVPPAWVRWR